MKEIIENLNKVFESRVRIGIMSVLSVSEEADFNELKKTLNITDGNLASHAAALEEEGYISSKRKLLGNKTKKTFSVTSKGIKAFSDHIDALDKLIKGIK
ncbi:transcriptional regulator [soil metagenome]